jgi:hypothetical protein
MSSVTLRPAAAVYREDQYFDWRVYAVIALVGLVTGLGLLRGRVWSREVAVGLIIGVAFLMFAVFIILHMTTEVGPTGLCVWFGWAPASPRVVSRPIARLPNTVSGEVGLDATAKGHSSREGRVESALS